MNPNPTAPSPVDPGESTAMLAQANNMVKQLGNIYSALNKALPIKGTGTFTLTTASTLTVSNAAVLPTSLVFPFQINASAGKLQGTTASLFVNQSLMTTGSFTVATANGTAPAGTEQYYFFVVNP